MINFLCVSPAAEQIPDFSGAWLLDPEHIQMDLSAPTNGAIKINMGGPVSVRNASDPPPETLPNVPPAAHIIQLSLRIVQTEDIMQIKRQFMLEGKERTIIQQFTTDGSQCINLSSDGTGEFVSRSTWKKNKLILSGIQTVAVQQTTEAHVTEEYSLSKDKNKLTIKTTSFMPQGVIKLKQEFILQKDPKP